MLSISGADDLAMRKFPLILNVCCNPGTIYNGLHVDGDKLETSTDIFIGLGLGLV